MVIAIAIRICAQLNGINKYSRTASTSAYGDSKTPNFDTLLRLMEGSNSGLCDGEWMIV